MTTSRRSTNFSRKSIAPARSPGKSWPPSAKTWASRRDERLRAAAGGVSARHPDRRRYGACRNPRQPPREARDALWRLSLRLRLAAGRGHAQRPRAAAFLSRRRDVRRDGTRLCQGAALGTSEPALVLARSAGIPEIGRALLQSPGTRRSRST